MVGSSWICSSLAGSARGTGGWFVGFVRWVHSWFAIGSHRARPGADRFQFLDGDFEYAEGLGRRAEGHFGTVLSE